MADPPFTTANAKADLRRKLRFRRDHHVAALPDFVRAIAFRAPPGPLRTLVENAACIGGYIALANEAPLDGLMHFAAKMHIPTALPAFAARTEAMAFCRWTPGDGLVRGPWGVNQPQSTEIAATPDLLLCPLLGFDRSGGRLGQGGGHYDRYFAAFPDAFRIGIAWSVQEVDLVPSEPHDVKLDAILTEQEWIVAGDRL